MQSTNDITGDSIRTKTITNSYRDNYDAIFRTKKEPENENTDSNETDPGSSLDRTDPNTSTSQGT